MIYLTCLDRAKRVAQNRFGMTIRKIFRRIPFNFSKRPTQTEEANTNKGENFTIGAINIPSAEASANPNIDE